jgi:hypothetical protein
MGQNLTTKSIEELSADVKRSGLAHHCRKIQEAENLINAAVEKALSKVIKPGESITIFIDDEGKIRLNPTLSRKITLDDGGNEVDATDKAVEGAISPESILDMPPPFEQNDIIIVTPSKGTKGYEYKMTKAPSSGVASSSSQKDLKDDPRLCPQIINDAGAADQEGYCKTFFFTDQKQVTRLVSSLSDEAKVMDEYRKLTTWVNGKETINKVIELRNVLTAMMDVLEDGQDNQTKFCYIDGLFLYMQSIGVTKLSYTDYTLDRSSGIKDLIKILDPKTSTIKSFHEILPLLHKYISYTSVDGFMTFLYSFWKSSNKETITGRVTAILRSKPDSGLVAKSEKTSEGKPKGKTSKTLKKGKEKGKGHAGSNQSKPKSKGNGKSQKDLTK